MPCLLTYQNFANTFWKRSPKEHFREFFSQSDKRFQRRRILKNFSEVHTVQKASPLGGHVFRRIKFSRTFFFFFFWKVSPKEQFCEIISKSDKRFQRRRILFEEFLWSAHREPPQAAMFFDGSKFSKHFLKRVTQGIILWNYSKFWPAVSEKIFLRISPCPYSAKSLSPPPPTATMFFDGSKFREHFLKKVTQGTFLWNYFKIGPGASEEDVLRISSYPYSANILSPHQAAMVFDG